MRGCLTLERGITVGNAVSSEVQYPLMVLKLPQEDRHEGISGHSFSIVLPEKRHPLHQGKVQSTTYVRSQGSRSTAD